MAKVYSSIAGRLRGRVGSTVYRKGQNATVASEYQSQVANPKTIAQAIRRCSFATVSAAQSSLRFLVDHSFEGVNGKRANLQRFMKENVNIFAADLKRVVTQQGSSMEGVVNIKGVSGIQPAPFVVSRGSLPFFSEQTLNVEGTFYGISLNLGGVSVPDVITSQADYETTLAAIGLQAGDQLSVISLFSTESTSGSYGGYQNLACRIVGSRVTFVTTLPENFSGALITTVDGVSRFNPALVARSEGNMLAEFISSSAPGAVDELKIGDGARQTALGEFLLAGCVIRSQIDQNGKYRYSTQSFVIDESVAAEVPDGAIASYMAATPSDMESQKFLDNPLLAV